ncbi:MAG: zinc metallopeptidase, partial [Gallionellaceae bacterium]|nr:zinc metallopeptidase [Gallionellaceae bacterium]
MLRRHGGERADLGHTGAQLARRLLGETGLADVTVEITEQGDHYDPKAKAVRLSAGNYHGRSLTAVTVAAHEVGHAIQDHSGYAPLAWRTRLVVLAQASEKVGAMLMLASPVLMLVTRRPASGLVSLVIGAAGFLSAALVHLVTLPVELDASYRRALPLLASIGLPERDLVPARRILTACAYTYVAVSLSGMLNIWRDRKSV